MGTHTLLLHYGIRARTIRNILYTVPFYAILFHTRYRQKRVKSCIPQMAIVGQVCSIMYGQTYSESVCVFSSHLFWTSSSLDVPAGVTQEEGHTGFLIHLSAMRALIFLAKRIQPFLSLVDREVEFCVLPI